ncbi:MAG: hypothetical protein ACTHM7_20375 [Ginsengibacter sp.]
MTKKIALKGLPLKEELKTEVPLFYHFIYYNKLKQWNPFDYTEFSHNTQSLVHFSGPEKPVSKIIDLSK